MFPDSRLRSSLYIATLCVNIEVIQWVEGREKVILRNLDVVRLQNQIFLNRFVALSAQQQRTDKFPLTALRIFRIIVVLTLVCYFWQAAEYDLQYRDRN